MKPAARLGDPHTCPVADPSPHTGGPVTGPGSAAVLIEEMPAAVLGDLCTCAGPPDALAAGSSTIFIADKPAAPALTVLSFRGKEALSKPFASQSPWSADPDLQNVPVPVPVPEVLDMPFDHERLDVYRIALDFIIITDDTIAQLPRGFSHGLVLQ